MKLTLFPDLPRWRPSGRLPTSGLRAVLVISLLSLLTVPVFASGGGPSLPINQMLEEVLDWLTGPMAVTLGTIALVAAAFVWMFLRHERGADFAFRSLLGTSIAIGAAAIIDLLVGSGALV